MNKSTHRPPYRFMLERLREARRRAHLTQVEVAAALETTQTVISKIERGERRLDPVELAEFAALYGVEVNTLLLRPPAADVPRAVAPQKREVWLAEEDAAALQERAYREGDSEDALLQRAVQELLKSHL